MQPQPRADQPASPTRYNDSDLDIDPQALTRLIFHQRHHRHGVVGIQFGTGHRQVFFRVFVGFAYWHMKYLKTGLGFALCVQVACNFANDLGDSLRGADTAARVGPRRAVSAGDIAPDAMRRGIWIACVLALVPALVQASLRLPVHIALSYDEEVGCLGVRSLLAELQQRPVKPLLCIIGEPTELKPVLGHKGKLAMRCAVHGAACHSAYAPQGVNARSFVQTQCQKTHSQHNGNRFDQGLEKFVHRF